VIITLLGLLAAGCSPKELPDWAVAGGVAPVAARIKAERMVEPQAVDRGPPPHVTPTKQQAELLPFTPEWQAREDDFDKRLRRTMDICRGC
jgi:hypothetical protein